MIDHVEFTWLQSYPTFKMALQETLGSSGQLIKKFFTSKEQDKKIQAKTTTKLPLNFVNHLKINPEYKGPEVKIISESDDYLALHKPPSVHCHPHGYEDKNTLLNFLVNQKKWNCLEVNALHYDRGLLYRLDFETSGVVILAKNEIFFQSMRENFNTSVRNKFYLVIVEGDFHQEGNWTHYFTPIGQKGSKQKVSELPSQGASQGQLGVKRILAKDGKTLLLVNLKTGLRHQIRAQLAFLGFPILGDELYGGTPSQRLFLHAFRYEFSENVQDNQADLFDLFFDLNSALKMTHDMLRTF
jgi:23S rRNA pseudouridine1911/1915/1917 synthase